MWSCFFALTSLGLGGACRTSGRRRTGIVEKKLKAEQFKLWALSLTGIRCPHHLTQGNYFEHAFTDELNSVDTEVDLEPLHVKPAHAYAARHAPSSKSVILSAMMCANVVWRQI